MTNESGQDGEPGGIEGVAAPARIFRDGLTPGGVTEFPIAAVIHEGRTAHQEVAIYDLERYGLTLVLDANIQSSASDEHLYHEALVQPAMLHLSSPARRVAVLGGGEGATLREVLRHDSVERAVMVDIDGEVVALCRRHLPTFHDGAFDDPRAEVRHEDARAFLERTDERFDAIVFDVTDPDDAPESLTRHLFDPGFFALVHRRLRDGGVFAMQLGPCFHGGFDAGARCVAGLRREFGRTLAGRVYVPVYLSPWGIALAGEGIETPPAAELAARIRARLAVPPRSLDATDIAPLLTLPRELRDAIAAGGR